MKELANETKSPIIKNFDLNKNPTTSIPVGKPLNIDPSMQQSATVNCVKTGDVVSQIHVTCACGQIIRIECNYD